MVWCVDVLLSSHCSLPLCIVPRSVAPPQNKGRYQRNAQHDHNCLGLGYIQSFDERIPLDVVEEVIAQCGDDHSRIQQEQPTAPVVRLERCRKPVRDTCKYQEPNQNDGNSHAFTIGKRRDHQSDRETQHLAAVQMLERPPGGQDAEHQHLSKVTDVVHHCLSGMLLSELPSQPKQGARKGSESHRQQSHCGDLGENIIATINRAAEIERQCTLMAVNTDHFRSTNRDEKSEHGEDRAEVGGVAANSLHHPVHTLQVAHGAQHCGDADHHNQRNSGSHVENERHHLGRPALADTHRTLHRIADKRGDGAATPPTLTLIMGISSVEYFAVPGVLLLGGNGISRHSAPPRRSEYCRDRDLPGCGIATAVCGSRISAPRPHCGSRRTFVRRERPQR